MRLPPTAVGVIAGVIAAAALTPLAADAIGDLRAARSTRATLAQIAAGPAPTRAIVADGYPIVAPDAAAAADMLAARLRAMAAKGGLLVEQAAPAPSPALARVRIRLSGSEDAVVAFADAVERTRPLARFASWSAQAQGGRVVLTGEVVAPWQ